MQEQSSTKEPATSAELSPRDQEIIDRARKSKTNAANSLNLKKHGLIDKKNRRNSFERTIKRVQSELSPAQRIFSKFIHCKLVESISDFIGSTIARPNAILAGSIVSFLFTVGIYVLAKTIGYTLSGFETIAAFLVGWAIGIFYDYIYVLATGNK